MGCAFYFFTSFARAITFYDAKTDYDQIVCVYPLSGQYGLLPRLLLYALIFFAVVSHSHIWLVTGAVAYIMTYAGTAAIRSSMLAFTSGDLYDLDSVGAETVLGVATMAAPFFVEYSMFILKPE